MRIINSLFRFIGWSVFGIVIFAVSLVGVFVGHIGGEKLVDFLDAGNRKEKIDYTFLKLNFMLSFEKDKETKVFEPRQAAVKLSPEHATQANQSLWVEIPAGRERPGIVMDVSGGDCFDWSDMKDFSFDVYNEMDLPARLTIVIKSGRVEPRKEYRTTLTLPARETGRFKISRGELENALDLSCISCVDIFMQEPPTTYYLYFDNMRVTQGLMASEPEPDVTEVRIQ